MGRVKQNQQNRSKGASHKNSNQRRLRQLALLFSSSFENDREILACDFLFPEIWRLKFKIQSEQFSTHLNASIRWSRSTEYVTGVEQQKNLRNGWQYVV